MIEPPEQQVRSIEERMGPELYARRRAIETGPRRMRGSANNWRERLMLRWQPHGLLRLLLKSAFLWNRGYRNFLNLRVVEVMVQLPRLPVAFDGFRILQLTDLHLDLAPELIPVIRKRLSGIGYDLVVITGDFKNRVAPPAEAAIALTQSLLPSLRPPMLATLGNHDTLALVEPLEASGLRFLLNESITLRRDNATLVLAGVDDSYMFRTDDIGRALEGVPEDSCKILLSHAPTNYEQAAAAGVDYFICGHTHGGQICWSKRHAIIPSGGVPAQLIVGRWKQAAMQGYTSRGTGACHVPIRFNCPGEITVHVLKTT